MGNLGSSPPAYDAKITLDISSIEKESKDQMTFFKNIPSELTKIINFLMGKQT